MLPDVAHQVLRVDEVIARVEIPVVLERQAQSARLVEHAHSRLPETGPVACRGLDRLHEDAPHVVMQPLVEDRREEGAELLGPHRPLGGEAAPQVRRVALLVDTFHDGDELHPVGPSIVPEEPVHLEGVVAVETVHRGEDVVFHIVFLEQSQPPHHLVERALTALRDSIGVVQLPRAVDADPDEEVVLGEELAPVVGEQGPVGLQRVEERHPRLAVSLLELDGRAVEVQAHQRRLAALPRHRHLRCLVGVDQ